MRHFNNARVVGKGDSAMYVLTHERWSSLAKMFPPQEEIVMDNVINQHSGTQPHPPHRQPPSLRRAPPPLTNRPYFHPIPTPAAPKGASMGFMSARSGKSNKSKVSSRHGGDDGASTVGSYATGATGKSRKETSLNGIQKVRRPHRPVATYPACPGRPPNC
jgi:hypothetical protein